jgi:hypothetical protein
MLLFRILFLAIGVFLLVVGRNNLRVAESTDKRDWNPELNPTEEWKLRRTTRVFGFVWIGVGVGAIVIALVATASNGQ